MSLPRAALADILHAAYLGCDCGRPDVEDFAAADAVIAALPPTS